MAILLLIVLIAVALLGNALAQAITHRIFLPGHLVFSLIAGVVCGSFILVVGLAAVMHGRPAATDTAFSWHTAAALLIYLSASFTFVIFVAGSQTSVRLEILRVLRAHPGGLTLAELDEIYSNCGLVRRRLNRLLSSGKVTFVDDRYRLTSPALLLVARFFRACKMLIYGVTSEFNLLKSRRRLGQDRVGDEGELPS